MQKTIRIEGMSCGHCSARVEKALRAIAGVRDVKMDLEAKTAAVEAEDSVGEAALAQAVRDSGYTVVGIG